MKIQWSSWHIQYLQSFASVHYFEAPSIRKFSNMEENSSLCNNFMWRESLYNEMYAILASISIAEPSVEWSCDQLISGWNSFGLRFLFSTFEGLFPQNSSLCCSSVHTILIMTWEMLMISVSWNHDLRQMEFCSGSIMYFSSASIWIDATVLWNVSMSWEVWRAVCIHIYWVQCFIFVCYHQ